MPLLAKCILGDTVKGFCRCVQALAKIGEDLVLEPAVDGLTLRAPNPDKSVLASLTFSPDFFVVYDPGREQSKSQSSQNSTCIEEEWIFRISMKCATMVFRSYTAIDKGVTTCDIEFDPEQKQVRFCLSCKHDVTKLFKFPILESEKLSAGIDKASCSNSAVIDSKILLETCGNFHSNTEEITIETARDKMTVRNFLENQPERNKAVRTEVFLAAAEFERYHIDTLAQITFCIKEFKPLLVLAESLNNLPISLYFDRPGRPFICSIESEEMFTADFLLSTLATTVQENENEAPKLPGIGTQELENIPHASKNGPSHPQRMVETSTEPIPIKSQKTRLENWRRVPSEVVADHGAPPENPDGGNKNRSRESSPVDFDEVDDVLPATPPPAKKFRSKFLNVSQATLYASQLQYSQANILAEDSDVEANEDSQGPSNQ